MVTKSSVAEGLPKSKPRRTPNVGSVSCAIAILHVLSRSSAPLGVNAISRAVKGSPSSCFNILKTLAAADIVSFDLVSKTYTLSFALVALARRALDQGGDFALVRSELDQIAERYGVASALWKLTTRERLVLLGFADSEAATRIHMTVGQRLPAFVAAMGRCVAARHNLPSQELRRRFTKLRWAQAPSFSEYKAQIKLARERGWAFDRDCFLRGVTTVAAPVLDLSGTVRFCVASTMFTGQYPSERIEEIGEKTLELAGRISRRIFGSE